MAKLTTIAVLLVAVVAIAEASSYITTITTTVIEEENPRGRGQQEQQCRQQVQRQQLQHCEMYLSQGRPYELVPRSILNPQEQHLRQCCDQLQNIDEECRCEAIRQLVEQQREQQEGGGRQGREIQEMMERARLLPRRCNMEPRECQIRAVFV